jgi:hypothetical protein
VPRPLIVINAGGKASSAEALQLLTQTMCKVAPNWSLASIAEAEAKLRQMTKGEFSTTYPLPMWHVERHWAGQGGFAQILLIKGYFQQQVAWTSWEDRAAGILLAIGTRTDDEEMKPGNYILAIGLHAKSGGD